MDNSKEQGNKVANNEENPSNNTDDLVGPSAVGEEDGNRNPPSSVPSTPFTNLSQVDADLALARTLQGQMSQPKEDPLINGSIGSEEKGNNQDQDVKDIVVSDDDVIDYSITPEFYDPNLDDRDQLWVQKKRKGEYSDAVLSCPACFTTLCLECQRHEKYVTQYRAVFVVNCKLKEGGQKRKRDRKGESFRPVCCSVCETEVGVVDAEEVYHFYNVLPSEC